MPHATLKTTFVYLLLQATLTNTAKNTARPVHEVINEQARVEDKKPLPYTNPLARTSNAKLHAEHQQAMFNAERVRQHRAQTQRWMMIPRVDSYMKAYQESQENHQLALEQMQSKLNKRPMKIRQEVKTRQEIKTLQAKEVKEIQVPELTKITKADAIVVNDKNRNQRSYGSFFYTPQKESKINITPSTTYDQGVTVKPNGNIGVNNLYDETKLYTEAVPSIVKYVYPKLYSQIHNYNSAGDIQALNYMLNKPAKDQLLELNTLIQSNKESEKELNTPTDLHFYLKDPSLLKEQIYSAPYATEYLNHYKDEKPITEEVDDIEDPNQFTNVKTYGVQVTSATPTNVETTTINSHYYNLELEQPYNPQDVKFPTQYLVTQEKPTLEELTYEKPTFEALTYVKPSDDYTKEENSKYVHLESTGVQHLSQGVQQLSHGVQHLSQDGTEVSAYADDDIHYAANYEFGYRVRDPETGNDFGHLEKKSGDKTHGQYHVLLPDGRMQQVRYSAGPGGYHADISYDHLQ